MAESGVTRVEGKVGYESKGLGTEAMMLSCHCGIVAVVEFCGYSHSVWRSMQRWHAGKA